MSRVEDERMLRLAAKHGLLLLQVTSSPPCFVLTLRGKGGDLEAQGEGLAQALSRLEQLSETLK